MKTKKLLATIIALGLITIGGVASYVTIALSHLPKMITVEDYLPLMVSKVYDRNGKQIGEYFRERRILTPYKDIPKHVVQAFLSAEDSQFFQHGGINYLAIARAMWANIKSGRKSQGASTITQQVARSLLLTREKTYSRKIKEIFLSYKMEHNLSKEEILWLYLNQIFLGNGAWGVAAASEVYFRKPLQKLSIAEAALLAGLPQAPTRYNPVRNPKSAKARQRYVLNRMASEGYITQDIANKEAEIPLKVYERKNYREYAPYFLETVKEMLVKKLGEENVLDRGVEVYTSLDIDKQKEAQKQVRQGLRDLDKRQGYRGAEKNLADPKEIAQFLLKTRDKLVDDESPLHILQADGTLPEVKELNLSGKDKDGKALPILPSYIHPDDIIPAIVVNVDDQWGLVYVRFAESKGLIDLDSMKWARNPDPNVRSQYAEIENPSEALKKGDVIEIKVIGKHFSSERIEKKLKDLRRLQKKKYTPPSDLPEFKEYALVELEQEPLAEAGLIAFDQKTQDIVSMVGGYDYLKQQYNNTYQARRQTGSSFKAIVYASALDKGFTPSTKIVDAPIVFEEADKKNQDKKSTTQKSDAKNSSTNNASAIEENLESAESPESSDSKSVKKWKPMNHSNRFAGDILFRNALIRSLNVPTIKIIEKLGIEWVADYAKRLGVFSPLNMDFTLALGSSGLTLYEMTKVFSEFGRMGKQIRPLLIHQVKNRKGEVLLGPVSLDEYFAQELDPLEKTYEDKRKNFLEFHQKYPQITTLKDIESYQGSDKPSLLVEAKKYLSWPPLYFNDSNQLIKPSTAYIITSLLQGVIEEPHGTGGAARSLGRPAAGKTGTTNGYFDGWFIGYTPQYATGVWVGFPHEKTLGKGEVGGKVALPIWLGYMKFAHSGLDIENFPVPDGIVFANIDNESGQLASASSSQVVKQAYLEGTEPTEITPKNKSEDVKDFYKDELNE